MAGVTEVKKQGQEEGRHQGQQGEEDKVSGNDTHVTCMHVVTVLRLRVCDYDY